MPELRGTSSISSSEKEFRLPASLRALSEESVSKSEDAASCPIRAPKSNSKIQDTAALEESRSCGPADVALYVDYN